MTEIELLNKIKTAKINRALGVFILIFGLIVLVAIAFTETFVQQMTDLVAGMVLILIGGGLFWKSQKNLVQLSTKNKSL